MCTNLSLLHAAGRVTDGGAAGGRGPSAPFQDRLQRKFALPGRMTGTFTEQGRPCPQERRPRTAAEINRRLPLALPPSDSLSQRPHRTLPRGLDVPIPSPGYSVVWEADLPGWLPEQPCPLLAPMGSPSSKWEGRE